MARPVLLHPRSLLLAMQIAFGAALLIAIPQAMAEQAQNTPQPPDVLLGPLFSDVQSAKLFPGSKNLRRCRA